VSDWIDRAIHSDWLPWAVGGFFALLIAALITFVVHEGREWERFKRDHDCKVVRKSRATTHQTFINGKHGIATTPGKTTWLCDDGVEYER
jgi:hypothetical protein